MCAHTVNLSSFLSHSWLQDQLNVQDWGPLISLHVYNLDMSVPDYMPRNVSELLKTSVGLPCAQMLSRLCGVKQLLLVVSDEYPVDRASPEAITPLVSYNNTLSMACVSRLQNWLSDNSMEKKDLSLYG